MTNLVTDEEYTKDGIDKRIKELGSLYELHNYIRSLIDDIQSDSVLKNFYELANSEFQDNSGVYVENHRHNYDNSDVYTLGRTIALLRDYVKSSECKKTQSNTKSLFHVRGVDVLGNDFISQCISIDMCDAIEMYKNLGHKVGSINCVTQVPQNEICMILDFKIFREEN